MNGQMFYTVLSSVAAPGLGIWGGIWGANSKCDFCMRKFARKSHLKRHTKRHLVCNSCNKEIVQPQDLQEHFVEDKNTGKYVCNYCNEQLSNFMTLIQHITRLHGNYGNYQCGLCQELESTEPTGGGYVCCVCDVVFDVPRELEDHMITHGAVQAD